MAGDTAEATLLDVTDAPAYLLAFLERRTANASAMDTAVADRGSAELAENDAAAIREAAARVGNENEHRPVDGARAAP